MPINACGLQASGANRAGIRYIFEDPDCWSATPTSGWTREMRLVSSSLAASKETVVSNEIRADRMVSDVVEVAASSGGEVNCEFSAGSLDDFMQAFLLGAWSKVMTFDKFEGSLVHIVDAGAATHIRISGGDYTPYFTTGQRLKTEGFLTAANNDYWQISSVDYNITATGETTIITTVDTGVTETGSAYTRVQDANDVIILKSTIIRAGTAGANSFDDGASPGTTFAAAIAAGELFADMKIFVDFKPAYETGTFLVAGTKQTYAVVLDVPVDQAQLIVDDGPGAAVTFEFDANGTGVTSGAVWIDTSSTNVDTVGALLAAAINNHADLSGLTATYDTGTNTLTIVNDFFTGASVTEAADSGTDIAITETVSGVATVQDGETVTVNDGQNEVIFEFDDDNSYTRGNVQVVIGASGAGTASNLQVAIMDQLRKGKLAASASLSSATVTVRNLSATQIDDAATTALSDTSTAVTTTSFANAVAASGFFTVQSVTASTITVVEDVGTHANGTAAAVTIKGSHLRNPGDLDDITDQSFTIETGFNDVGQYFVQKGMRVGGFQLAVSVGEIVTAQLAFMGKDTSTRTSTLLGTSPYTVREATGTPVFNATTNVGTIYKNGEVLATAVQSIELNGEATLREQRAVGSKYPAGIGVGRFNLTGTVTTYFETLEMYDHFLNHDSISLSFPFTDADKNSYWFTVPNLKITSDPIAPGGIDQDVMEELEFVALRDPVKRTQFMIDRFSSVVPASS